MLLGLPFSAVVVLFGMVRGRRVLARRPVLAFLFVSFVAALLLLLGWGLYWGAFPELSQVGLL